MKQKIFLPDGSYSVLGIHEQILCIRCFEYAIKKYRTVTDNSPIRIYVNKIKKNKNNTKQQ